MDSKLIRGNYISKKLKHLSEINNIKTIDIAKQMSVAQPTISAYLNTRKIPSDEYYRKMGKIIGLSHKEIDNLFQEADTEAFIYKHGTPPQDPNLLEDIDFDVALRKEYGKELSPEGIIRIKEFIEFVKNK